MKKTKKLTEEQRLLLPFVLLGVVCMAIAIVIACVQGIPVTDYAAAVREVGEGLFVCGVLYFAGVLIAGISWVIVRFTEAVDKEAIRLALHRIGVDFSNSTLEKNTKVISYRLQYFLFDILSRNNGVFHLPLGEDFGCLTPRELVYGCRDNCVIYYFDLIVPNKPEMDIITLRKIIHSYIVGELNNYGIIGLNRIFKSKTLNCNCWSVYLDRVTYHEAQHRLTFEVLYVYTEKTAGYLAKAIQRDKVRVQTEQDFYDDDLQ